jgi:hypothetical protein
MFAYRVDMDRAIKLIECVRPRLCYVNGIFGSGKTYFAEHFKAEGYNVLSLDKIYTRIQNTPLESMRDRLVTEVHSHLRRFTGVVPIIVEGFLRDPAIIQDIFSEEFEIFTYVYIYPNNPKRYKERIESNMAKEGWHLAHIPYSFPPSIIDLTSTSEGKSNNTIIRELIDINKKVYESHLSACDSRMLTVLN